MPKYFLTLLIACFSSLAWAQNYDMSDGVIKTSHLRSDYFVKDSLFSFGLNFEDFLSSADKSKPVVVHSHGCAGKTADEQLLRSFYTGLGFNFVMLDFHKRRDAGPSCMGGPISGFQYFGNLKTRLPARVAELMNHVDVLRNNGFTTIYATGHSEGGMVVQLIRRDVDAAIVHSMSCIPLRDDVEPSHLRLLHLVSLNDPLLVRADIRHVCTHRQNYTAAVSNVPSHGALADSSWGSKIKAFLGKD
jgi:predicted alpha/beta-hydrolase family hydrolase